MREGFYILWLAQGNLFKLSEKYIMVIKYHTSNKKNEDQMDF